MKQGTEYKLVQLLYNYFLIESLFDTETVFKHRQSFHKNVLYQTNLLTVYSKR